jgi:hypothetical protein
MEIKSPYGVVFILSITADKMSPQLAQKERGTQIFIFARSNTLIIAQLGASHHHGGKKCMMRSSKRKKSCLFQRLYNLLRTRGFTHVPVPRWRLIALKWFASRENNF